MDFIINLLASDIRFMSPILIAALGLLISERAGVVNIGAEGIMLIGALMGSVGAYYFGSPWGGVLLAALAGLLVGLIFALLVVTVRANQTVVGAAINTLGTGVTILVNRAVFGSNTGALEIKIFSATGIPLLRDIPVLGDILFSRDVLFYFALVVLFLSQVVLFRTKLGLKVRAVGEMPKACDTLGINVYRVRYGAILYSTMMCGIGGAAMTLAQVSMFSEGMVAGRGFIALAAVVFGRWTPLGTFGAVFVFCMGLALQSRMQLLGLGLPNQFFMMLPYLLTLVALMITARNSKGPAASGIPYRKE